MKFIITITLFHLTGYFQKANSQNNRSTQTAHSFYGGATQFVLRDSTLNQPQLHGNGFAAGYQFSWQSSNRKKSFSILWQKAFFAGDKKTKFNSFQLRLTDGYRIFKYKSNNRLTAFVGYSITANPAFISFADKSSKMYTWNTINSLNFYNSYSYKWKKSFFALDIDIPLVGLASRPSSVSGDEYETDINGVLYESYSNLFLSSLHNYRAVSISLEYRHFLKPTVHFFAGLAYSVKDLDSDPGSFERSSGINAGLILKIK